jgi:hypothetical protein
MLGLESEWAQVKRSYAEANLLLGDIIKVRGWNLAWCLLLVPCCSCVGHALSLCYSLHLCVHIVQVTPSSKVVGDLAQFMVAKKLTPQMVIDKAAELDLPRLGLLLRLSLLWLCCHPSKSL